ncbi:HNH endonuclease domain-containing protein [Persicitalea sp.]|uniref:HNH endonuclease domain-containing protein n=1 Tax=Persicitalea sp. TaxID=3100273 RepID=UPI0035941602
MSLPESDDLDIAALSGVFKDRTNSYKFYWFLSILDILQENGERIIRQNDIALRMLANVWYPLDYYKLSFGTQDGFKQVAAFISSKFEIDNRLNAPGLSKQIRQNLSESELLTLSQNIDKNLIRWVPFRFIRPFFALETQRLSDHKVNGAIKRLSNELFVSQPQRVVYRILDDSIELNAVWVDYFQHHQSILRGFIFWHLVGFVQKNNPNVIGLTEKLEKPRKRDLSLAKKFWKGYLDEHSNLSCIYSGEIITRQNISLDHFLPWSYVAHDQLWNIVPTPKRVNSSKSNCLPSEQYFKEFTRLQYQVVQFYLNKQKLNVLEDYDQIFRTDLRLLSLKEFTDTLQKYFLPHFQTAKNLGFTYPYIYQKDSTTE